MSFLQPPNPKAGNDNNASTFELTIRFSESLPDLPLSIPSSATATTSTLKQLIRAAIPQVYKDRRIRLIYAGKALLDDTPLVTSLKLPSRPPSRVATPGPYEQKDAATDSSAADVKSKGKTPIRDPPVIQPRIYIHCSIGDVVLTPAELAAEVALANRKPSADTSQGKGDGEGADVDVDGGDSTTTTPAPRGFDRLLNAGFSAGEVQTLRLQFMAIQSHTHTPDTMPSPNTLRNMEDQWLDNSNAADGSAGAGGVGAMSDEDAQVGALDDMIWGATMGFFWPVGCLMWGTREDGIWSQRRKMAVVVGVALNIGLGFVRYTS